MACFANTDPVLPAVGYAIGINDAGDPVRANVRLRQDCSNLGLISDAAKVTCDRSDGGRVRQ